MSRDRVKRGARSAALVAILVLFVASVPWYRTAGDDAGRWLGLPGWVTVALLCYVGVAFLNAVAWLLTDIKDAVPPCEKR